MLVVSESGYGREGQRMSGNLAACKRAFTKPRTFFCLIEGLGARLEPIH